MRQRHLLPVPRVGVSQYQSWLALVPLAWLLARVVVGSCTGARLPRSLGCPRCAVPRCTAESLVCHPLRGLVVERRGLLTRHRRELPWDTVEDVYINEARVRGVGGMLYALFVGSGH